MSGTRWALLLIAVAFIAITAVEWWLKAPVITGLLWVPTVRLLRKHGFIRERVSS